MNRTLKCTAALLTACLLLASCKKKFDEYYERPDNLAPAIYQQLQDKGNFTKFLALIDKAGYKETLGAAGYWTLFAPSDSAFNADADFKAYLAAKGFSGPEAMDAATAQSIVQYLLVYNAFNLDRIDDYQANTGWVPNQAFKRRTAYYTGFYNDTTAAGQTITALASNRNNAGQATYYNTADNNNKYIPFFTKDYFALRGLTASDYNYFYPASVYTGFNVAAARVTQKDIAAENGVIHVIDRVITPLFNLDQYLRVRPEYSEFKKLLDTYMVTFIQNADATRKYQVLTGVAKDVYIKVFSNLLAFSPNNENYFKLQDNDGQGNGWTMFAPTNDVLKQYIAQITAEGYGDLSKMPAQVIADLINSHLWQFAVWPSKFTQTFNFLGEAPHLSATADVVDKKVLSNGFFYGTSKVNEPNLFSTVYGKAYLNPKYTMMTVLLNTELRTIITNPNFKYAVFMMPNEVLAAKSFSYDPAANTWSNGSNTNDSNRLNLLRILNSGVVETPNNDLNKLMNLSPGDSGTIVTFGGEYIKYRYNAAAPVTHAQIITAGTRDANVTVLIDSFKVAKNGVAFYLNNLLQFTYQPIGVHLETLGTPTTSEFNYYWNYLKNSTAWDANNKSIVGIAGGSFYTVFVPKNDAVKQAVVAGLLPGTVSGSTVTPNFNPTLAAEKKLVENFILYHVLDKRTVAADGRDNGAFPTLLKNAAGDPVYISLANTPGTLQISDFSGRKANLIPAQSSNLSNRTLIHLIDNYLKYN